MRLFLCHNILIKRSRFIISYFIYETIWYEDLVIAQHKHDTTDSI